MSLPQRVEPAPLTAAELLAEVARLYRQLQTLPFPDGEHVRRQSPAYRAIEAQIRAYSERVWAFETEGGTPIVGKLGGRRRPYLVLGANR